MYSSNKSLFSTIKLKTNRTESDIGFSNLYLVKQICMLNCNRFHYQEKKEGNVETGKNDGEPLPVEKRSQDMACDDTYMGSISQNIFMTTTTKSYTILQLKVIFLNCKLSH